MHCVYDAIYEIVTLFDGSLIDQHGPERPTTPGSGG
jgi:hypothetical protein